MGDRLRAGKPPQYFTKPPRPTQLPTFSGTGNEYQSKCGDALRLGLKANGSFHLWMNVWVHALTGTCCYRMVDPGCSLGSEDPRRTSHPCIKPPSIMLSWQTPVSRYISLVILQTITRCQCIHRPQITYLGFATGSHFSQTL